MDDGSTDRTLERAEALAGRYGGTTLRVVSKSNGGKASALNTGIALARHDYVLCMDGDSRLDPGTLRAAMRHFADPRVGAVAGNVKVVNRDNVWTRLQALEYLEGLNMARRAQGFLRVVNIIPGPIGVFRRDVLRSVGGYDTDTFAEDADLTLKILTAGWHVAYEERAIAYTEAPEQFVDLVKQRYRWTRGILQALRKRARWLVSPRRGAAHLGVARRDAVRGGALAGDERRSAICSSRSSRCRSGAASGVFYWWVLLTMLDVAAALYAVGIEGEELRLVPYAVLYRFFFITMIDVAKLFATAEEVAARAHDVGQARASRENLNAHRYAAVDDHSRVVPRDDLMAVGSYAAYKLRERGARAPSRRATSDESPFFERIVADEHVMRIGPAALVFGGPALAVVVDLGGR